MPTISKLIVKLNLEGSVIEVGELVRDKRKIYFKYYPDFIEKKLAISPFKLPFSTQILRAETSIFDGLFGVFHDSLPDGWGRLLLDRALTARGISISELTPLDRLTFVGNGGKGALTYQPAMENKYWVDKHLELDKIASETQKVLAGSSTDIIEELYDLGGSSGGARPKIFVGYHPEKDHLIHGKTNLPAGYEHWIIKFPASTDLKDMAQIEYTYYKMAVAAGLEMSPCKLFKGQSGQYYFGTKRFDRVNNKRLHLHSAAGLMNDNFRLSNMDYGHVMDAAFRLENQVAAYEKVLRLAAFNIYTHNRDDHSKNISFLMNLKGEWQLAPVYDLTFSSSGHGYHSMTVGGEWQSPNRNHLLALADTFGVKSASSIIELVRTIASNWINYAKENGVRTTTIKMIDNTLNKLT